MIIQDRRDEFDGVRWKQGRLLITDRTRHWDIDRRNEADAIEQCSAYAGFTGRDEGRGRELVFRFPSPSECKAAVDAHNSRLSHVGHTPGPWTSRRYNSVNVAIGPDDPVSGIVVALAQGPGIGGPVSDAERAANIRLVKQAPLMFEAIRSAHKLIADGWTEKAQCVLMDAIGAVERGARQ